MPLDIDATGAHTPSLDEALIDQLTRHRLIFGADLAIEAQTPTGQMAGIAAIGDVEASEALAELSNATNPDNARGPQLDWLGALTATRRRPATRSVVTATLTGVAGTNIPAGTRARTTSGDQFETLASIDLAAGGVNADMQAVEEGAVEAPIGTLTERVTIIGGWEGITNTAAATVGRAAETDPAYRASMETRALRAAEGPLTALRAAIAEANADDHRVIENATRTATTEQEFTLDPSSLLAVIRGGLDSDMQRAIEQHRGQGVATMTAVIGGTPDNTALDAVTDGTVEFAGTAYTGLDLSSATTAAAKAAALTTLLDSAGVTVSVIDDTYVAQFAWRPDTGQTFGDGTVETAFGLDPDAATDSVGPFLRPRDRALTVTIDVIRLSGFPADGLDLIRAAVRNRVTAYGLGATVYLNDLLAAAQGIAGAQVTSITVQHDSADVNGTVPPLDSHWTVGALTIDIT